MSDKMRILLVRHGESEGNVDARAYLEKGDSGVGLTEKGWHQAINTGKFLSGHYRETAPTDWPMIHVSTHKRTLETLSGILHGMNGTFKDEPKIYPQSFLVEKFFGAASALHFPDENIPKDFQDNMLRLSQKVYGNDSYTAKHLFGESTKDTRIVAKLFMDGTLRRDMAQGKNDFLIVCHGAVIQAIIMNTLHARPEDKDKIGNPGNGDIIEISGAPKNLRVIKIWDGENAVPVHRNYRDGLPRFTTADLPPVPDFIKAPLL